MKGLTAGHIYSYPFMSLIKMWKWYCSLKIYLSSFENAICFKSHMAQIPVFISLLPFWDWRG